MDFLLYIAKSTGILSLFYVIYRFVLNNDTFFIANRVFLLSGIIAAFLLPFLSYDHITYVIIPAIENATEYNFDPSLYIPPTIQTETIETYTIDWLSIALIVYSIGVLHLLSRLYIQILSVFRLIRSGNIISRNKFTFIDVSSDVNPFSFFNYIVYNPAKHTKQELEMILAHEQVHAGQKHSIDILITQIILCLQWINPLVWFYKKCLEQNLEYLADSEAIKKTTNVKQYQHTLVKVSSTSHTLALTNPFYQSLIKKRIVMLNKPQSHKRNLWKLSLVLPLLAFFMYSFNVKEVIEYVDEETPAFAKAEKNSIINKGRDVFYIDSNSNTGDLDRIESYVSKHWNNLTIQFDKRDFTPEGRLAGFTFQTKFNKNDAFSNRFSFDKNTRKDWEGCSLMVNTSNEIIVMEKTDGSFFKITDEKIIVENGSYSISTEEENVNHQTDKDKILGKNPVLIVNDQIIIDKEKDTHFTADSITTVLPKEAVKSYGPEANDGAIILHNTTKTDQVQVNDTESFKEKTPLKNIYRFKITKDTQDKEIERLIKTLKEKHNAFLKIEKLKRNNKGEIIGLHLYLVDTEGNSMSNVINSSNPINDLYIYKEADGTSGMGNSPFFRVGSENTFKDISKQREAIRKRRDSIIKYRNTLNEEYRKTLLTKRDSLREYLKERSSDRKIYIDSIKNHLLNEYQKELKQYKEEVRNQQALLRKQSDSLNKNTRH